MGSQSSIFEKKVNRRVKWITYFSIPVLLLGSVALVLQLFFFRGSTDFFRFDFKTGILWKWQEDEPDENIKPEIISKFYPQNLGPENFINVPANEGKRLDYENYIAARQPEIAATKSSTGLTDMLIVSGNSLKDRELFQLILPGEAMKRLESPTIFNPNARCKSSKWSVGISLSPAVSYRTFSYANRSVTNTRVDGNTNYVLGQSEKYRNKYDKSVMTFFGSVDVYYEISPRITLQSGIGYGTYGEQIKVGTIDEDDPNLVLAGNRKDKMFTSAPVYCPAENEMAENEKTVPFLNQYKMIEIPLVLNYKVVRKKLLYEAQIGTSVSKLDYVDALVYDFKSDYYYWVPTAQFNAYNQYFISGIAGFSVNQMVNKNAEIFINPQYKFVFTPTYNGNYPVKQNQWATLLRMGIKFHL